MALRTARSVTRVHLHTHRRRGVVAGEEIESYSRDLLRVRFVRVRFAEARGRAARLPARLPPSLRFSLSSLWFTTTVLTVLHSSTERESFICFDFTVYTTHKERKYDQTKRLYRERNILHIRATAMKVKERKISTSIVLLVRLQYCTVQSTRTVITRPLPRFPPG